MVKNTKQKIFNEQFSKTNSTNNGITLIALVVTIIVLLILLGTAVASITGRKGVIGQAQDAKTASEIEDIRENITLAYVQAEGKRQKANEDLSSKIKEELEKDYNSNEVTVSKEQNGTYKVEVKNKTFIINNKDKVLTEEEYSLESGGQGGGASFTGLSASDGDATLPSGVTEVDYANVQNTNLKDTSKIKAVIKGTGANNSDEVPIPVNAKYKEGTENTGVVIEYKGSEFVWVPVPTAIGDTEANGTTNKAMALNIGTAGSPEYRGMLYDFSGSGSSVTSSIKSGCTTTTSSFREPDIVTSYDSTTKTYLQDIGIDTNGSNPTAFLNQLKADYKEMVESVDKYGGFYVGRYETSIDTTKTPATVASKKSPDATTIMPMTAETSLGNKWYGMYDKQRKFSGIDVSTGNANEDKLQSSMIWGSQYDAMLNWMITGNEKAKIMESDHVNHNLSAAVGCGTNNKSGVYDIINNIYDLEGNVREWTLEACDADYRVFRGGFYYYALTPSFRSNDNPFRTNSFDGSRLSLYIE